MNNDIKTIKNLLINLKYFNGISIDTDIIDLCDKLSIITETFEIIKKYNVDILRIRKSKSVKEYNQAAKINYHDEISPETFNKIKEVIKCNEQ